LDYIEGWTAECMGKQYNGSFLFLAKGQLNERGLLWKDYY